VGVLDAALAQFATESGLPLPQSLHGIPLFPSTIGTSIGQRFAGRAEDLWRLHNKVMRRGRSSKVAPSAAALFGLPGNGKTRAALEYLHRFGPTHFRGGLFWIDGGLGAPGLRSQHYGILRALRTETPPLATLGKQADIAGLLADAVHNRP